jgi:hypothetical protein
MNWSVIGNESIEEIIGIDEVQALVELPEGYAISNGSHYRFITDDEAMRLVAEGCSSESLKALLHDALNRAGVDR